jgi:hypothetical protein
VNLNVIIFAVGTVTLKMESSLNPPLMTMTLSMSPFQVSIGSANYGSTLTSPPVANKPFDFLITCDVDNFKLFVNGEQISGTISNFHIKAGTLVTPTVTAISYNIPATANMKITRISWNYGELLLTPLFLVQKKEPNLS